MENIEFIDKYLRGKLTDSEKNEFFKKIDSDDEFAEQFKVIKNIKAGVHNIEKQKLKYNLRNIAIDHKEAKTKFSTRRRIIFSAAAAVLLILSVPTIRFFVISYENSNYTAKEVIDRKEIKYTAFKPSDFLDTNNEKTIYDNIRWKNYVVSVYDKPDSSNYGFLPVKKDEYSIKLHICRSDKNSYSYDNKKLILNTETELSEIVIYEELDKNRKSALYISFNSNTYQIQNTKKLKKLVPIQLE